MKDLCDFLEKAKDKLRILAGDIERMKVNAELPEEDKKDMKSLRPVTRLRKNVAEAKEAAENPDTTFIIDQLKDAFEG